MKMIFCLSARGEELCRHFVTGAFTFETLHYPRNEWRTKPVHYIVHELVEYTYADA